MLGQEVYFCDKKTWGVRKGTVLSHIIGSSGYEMYTIMDDKGISSVETALIFTSEDDAQRKCEQAKPISDTMEKLEKEMIEELNALREQVIGKPQHKELADALKNKGLR